MIQRVSTKEGRQLLAEAQKKPHKYHAKAITVDGRRFDSTLEANVAAVLRLEQRLGIISSLEYQPVYELHAPNGEVVGSYVADFRFVCRGQVRLVDVKGMKTLPIARWKQKHLRAEYGIVVEERR